ncbi:hypothetical protein GUITHDRAFT_110383 [Guillardia theta CCMP2712]|uniref:Nudix hydrolase domain-containing protein n=1 Tax=Guillardia theta (strain CCMP2712) TaxID=905079 RepID=L1J4W8_GUITC|nr:hypothetical protein GUITHDRAFT_110383 [Guillardia theta CCMP2712]EKX43578.1 hypothetical protein GUITHDRAFT_110383 [Guillardia theta CCMP2712]|eukprot:XP_005830558.1 hypothetical protein GUITHDRAFT_110383 [Guillardia theta CCMP2712]
MLNSYKTTDFIPFSIESEQLGWLRKEFATRLHSLQLETKQKVFTFEWPQCSEDGSSFMPGNVGLHENLLSDHPQLHDRSAAVNDMVSSAFNKPPALLLERGCVPYFGVAAYGVHVNVLVREERGTSVWIAKRALTKATYPGKLDQCVAGGQPQGLSLTENVVKECEEEAGIPQQVAATARPVGAVSYMYATNKGLSPKTLFCYDLEVPRDFVPRALDGEVDSFQKMPIEEAMRSVADQVDMWKPNSALVMIDLAIRHGILNGDEPNYLEILSLLRRKVSCKAKHARKKKAATFVTKIILQCFNITMLK